MLVFIVDVSIYGSFVGIASVVNRVVVDSRVSSGIVLRVGSAIFREIGASSAIASLSDSVSDFKCASGHARQEPRRRNLPKHSVSSSLHALPRHHPQIAPESPSLPSPVLRV